MKKTKTQVEKNHYFSKKYITKGRWMNYYYQILEILNLKPKKVLVIGIGDSIVPNYLKNFGLETITFDFDESLNPDIVGDLKYFSKYIKKEKFDVILCAHVLEHLPFKYFDLSLKEFSKVSKYVVLQLPPSILQLRFKLALQPYFFDLNFNLNMPLLFWKKYKFNGEHYWQPYRKDCSMFKIREIIKKNFIIIKQYQNPENHFSYNFILESKK